MTTLAKMVNGARRHTIGDTLRRTARRYPNKVALRCGAIFWTYQEFDRVCNQAAHGLSARGVNVGDRVAILSRNSHAFAVLRFAIARLGAVLVPINFMLNAEEISFILRNSGAKVLAAGPEFVEIAHDAARRDTQVALQISLPGENTPAMAGHGVEFSMLLEDDSSLIAVDIDGSTLAQIIYTSGTEALPKGAMLTHDAVLWEWVSCIIDGGMVEGDVMLHALPLYHCAQLDVFLGPAVYLGMTSIITGQSTPDNILPLLQQHRITSFFAPPTVWIGLLRSPQLDRTDVSSLEKGYYGASIMPVEVLRELQQRLPRTKLWNFYGQTEIAPLATALQPEDQLRKAGSAGRPALNVETRVVNEAMHDVEPGEIGEIVHRSPQLLTGYYNDPDRTAAAFVGGWFHSGDLAIVDEEGFISVVDRKKDMIKTGGENVASREVEEAIYLLPQVSEVAVIGLPHPHWIEAVTAVVVVKVGQSLSEDTLAEHCNQKLAAYKRPKRFVFVESLPKNPSGKVMKRELRTKLAGAA
jgi:fatty-acyl-CoA synthase